MPQDWGTGQTEHFSLFFLSMRSNRTTQARRHNGKNKSFTARNIEATPPKVLWGAVPGT